MLLSEYLVIWVDQDVTYRWVMFYLNESKIYSLVTYGWVMLLSEEFVSWVDHHVAYRWFMLLSEYLVIWVDHHGTYRWVMFHLNEFVPSEWVRAIWMSSCRAASMRRGSSCSRNVKLHVYSYIQVHMYRCMYVRKYVWICSHVTYGWVML